MLRKIKISLSQQKSFFQNDKGFFFQIFSAARNLNDCLMLFHAI